MATDSSTGSAYAPFRPLSKQDIDRRIERVLEDVAAAGERIGDDREEGPGRPRRIAPRDLVERVRPFLSLN